MLVDRRLSRHEEDELVAAAEMMSVSREDAVALHRFYLGALGRLALNDGILTDEERRDLETVGSALGLCENDVCDVLGACATTGEAGCPVGRFALAGGDAVVFTGEAPGIDRPVLESQARSLGLRVMGSVSGKTALVVAADLDSLSSKARRARQLDIPIVGYATYLRMLDSLGE